MLKSSHETNSWPSIVGVAVVQDGVEDVDLAAGQSGQGLVMSFAFRAFTVVEGSRGRIALHGTGRGLVEDPLEDLVTAGRAARVADLFGLGEHRGQAGYGCQGVAAGEAADVADRGEELGCESAPIPGRLWMRAPSGWPATSCSISASSVCSRALPVRIRRRVRGRAGQCGVRRHDGVLSHRRQPA